MLRNSIFVWPTSLVGQYFQLVVAEVVSLPDKLGMTCGRNFTVFTADSLLLDSIVGASVCLALRISSFCIVIRFKRS